MDNRVQLFGTLTLLGFALAHAIVPAFRVENQTIALLVFAFIPWLYKDLQSLEILGVFKMNLVKLDDKMNASSLSNISDEGAVKQSQELYGKMALVSPDMAVRGVKADIDKGLVKVAEKLNISVIGGRQKIVDELVKAEQLTSKDKEVLGEIFKLYQKSSNIIAKSNDAVDWLVKNGPRIAQSLEAKFNAQPET